MAKKSVKTVEEYKAEVASIVADELAGYRPGEIRELVRTHLSDTAFELVTEALGLTRRWDRWEVDHCNGLRNAAADVMLSEAKDAARTWLKEQAGALPELPKTAVAALHRDYKERLEREISDELRERARGEAVRIVNAMLLKGEAA